RRPRAVLCRLVQLRDQQLRGKVLGGRLLERFCSCGLEERGALERRLVELREAADGVLDSADERVRRKLLLLGLAGRLERDETQTRVDDRLRELTCGVGRHVALDHVREELGEEVDDARASDHGDRGARDRLHGHDRRQEVLERLPRIHPRLEVVRELLTRLVQALEWRRLVVSGLRGALRQEKVLLLGLRREQEGRGVEVELLLQARHLRRRLRHLEPRRLVILCCSLAQEPPRQLARDRPERRRQAIERHLEHAVEQRPHERLQLAQERADERQLHQTVRRERDRLLHEGLRLVQQPAEKVLEVLLEIARSGREPIAEAVDLVLAHRRDVRLVHSLRDLLEHLLCAVAHRLDPLLEELLGARARNRLADRLRAVLRRGPRLVRELGERLVELLVVQLVEQL